MLSKPTEYFIDSENGGPEKERASRPDGMPAVEPEPLLH